MKGLKIIILLLLITFNVCGATENMEVRMTVIDLVTTVCKKMPMTNLKRCIKKKMECIDENYEKGMDIEPAIFDCF